MPKQRVLVVDDSRVIRLKIRTLLEREGLEVASAENGERGLEELSRFCPDLVVTDLEMPVMGGFEMCRRMKAEPRFQLTPVIIVTSEHSTQNMVDGLRWGASDFIGKPFKEIELIARVRAQLSVKRATDDLERAESVLFAIARSIEGKDAYTGGHCERLSRYSVALGSRLGLDADQLLALERGGVVHDVGKVAVPDAILLKPGKLDDEEWAVMRTHPVVGAEICHGLRSFRLVIPIIRHHHERLDGSGYPDGLVGEQIPLTARILQIVDIFDAMTTERPYREAWPVERALSVMQDEVERGWWDAQVFDEFAALVREDGFELQLARSLSDCIESGVTATALVR